MPSAEELKMLQSLPLDVKIRKTEQRIIEFVDRFGIDGCYVAISGGKDSQVLAHIVKRLYKDIPLVFSDTGLEMTSVRNKALEITDYVIKPSKDFVTLIKQYGYPFISKDVSNTVSYAKPGNTRWNKLHGDITNHYGGKSKFDCSRWLFLLDAPFKLSDKCCYYSKKNPFIKYDEETNRHPFLGMMASESQKRRNGWLKTGCNAFDLAKPQSQPMAFWTEQDILEYIHKYDLRIADAYGNVIYGSDGYHTSGVDRTGCAFCGFGIVRDKDRFIQLKENDPKLYDYVIRGGCFDDEGFWIPGKDENGVFGLGYKFVIDWLNENGNLGIKY